MEYQIDKKLSKSKIIQGIVPIISFLLFTFVIPTFVLINRDQIPLELGNLIWGLSFWGFMFIIIFIIYYNWLKPWKFPFKAKWDKEGITINNQNGKITQIIWQDVVSMRLTNENTGRNNWRNYAWLVYAGKGFNEFKFIDFKLKNNKSIFVPIPSDNFNDAMRILAFFKINRI